MVRGVELIMILFLLSCLILIRFSHASHSKPAKHQNQNQNTVKSESYLRISYYSDDGCHNEIESAVFILNKCALSSKGYFMKFNIGKNNEMEFQIYHDNQCLKPIDLYPINSNLSKCENRRFISPIRDITELRKSKQKIMFNVYDGEETCHKSEISRGLLQAKYFPERTCLQTIAGDHYFSECMKDTVRGHYYLSNDGSCSGSSHAFIFSSSDSCSIQKGSDLYESEFFGFQGHHNIRCLD